MEIFVSCNPPKSTAQASLRIITPKGKKPFIGKYSSSKAKAVEAMFRDLFDSPLLKPTVPYSGPIKVSVTWIYPWRSTERKKNKIYGLLSCTTRPDIDNLCKTLFDILTKIGYWSDDSIIADLRFRKYWGDEPGIGIKIEDLAFDPF